MYHLLAHPGATVRIGTGRGLRTVVELQFVLVSLDASVWVGFRGLTYPM